MAFRVTQCPSCESTFNTSPRVLETAAGKVRCGACLTVFDATDNFLGDDQTEAIESVFVSAAPTDYFDPSRFLTRSALQTPDPEPAATPEPAAADAEEENDNPETLEFFAAVSDTFEAIDTYAEDYAPPGNTDPLPAWQLFPASNGFAEPPWTVARPADRAATAPEVPSDEKADDERLPPEPSSAAPADTTAAPESFSLRFNFTLSSAVQAAEERPDPTAISLSWSGRLETAAPDPAAAPPDELNEEGPVRDFQDAIADTLQDDPSASGESAPAAQPDATDAPDYIDLDTLETGQPTTADSAAEADGDTAESDEAEPSVEAIRARALQTELEDEEALEAIPSESLAALKQFTSPVEFLAGRSRRWRRQAGWTVLALLAGALLAAQYLWQEMAVYSQSPRLRPLYAWACGLTGCELPTYSDVDAIRSDILTVRSHPEINNALAVNVEFRNTAPFPQPFPVMVLSFNTAANNVMALREFAPTEYLDPALARRALMPVMNPVQVNLEIIDPGPDAVNYTLGFRRP